MRRTTEGMEITSQECVELISMVNIIKRVVPHIKGISCNAKLKTNTGYALNRLLPDCSHWPGSAR